MTSENSHNDKYSQRVVDIPDLYKVLLIKKNNFHYSH